jgi:hypothetical protein
VVQECLRRARHRRGQRYGTGWATSRREAEDLAMSNCNDIANECSVLRWVCTSR